MTDDLMARLRHGSVCVEIEDDQTMNEAADALEAQARRIAELEAQTKSAEACCDSYATENQQFHDRIEAQAARIAELTAALKPFADEAQFYDHLYKDEELADEEKFDFTIGDLRAARDAYSGEKND